MVVMMMMMTIEFSALGMIPVCLAGHEVLVRMMTFFSSSPEYDPYLSIQEWDIGMHNDLIFSPGYDPYLSSREWGIGMHDDFIFNPK